MVIIHKTSDETKKETIEITIDQTLDSILAQNPYLGKIEDKRKERKNFSRSLHSGDELGYELRFRQMEELEDSIKSLEVKAAHWEYEQCLKYHQLTPIEIPSYIMERIEPVLKEMHQYAPEGATVKIRVHNCQEPFQRPKIRIEVLGVLNGSETVRARFEDSVGEFFSHPVLDKPREFTYDPDNTVKSIASFKVMKLPELSYKLSVHQSTDRKWVLLRRKGYYLFVPFIIDDK